MGREDNEHVCLFLPGLLGTTAGAPPGLFGGRAGTELNAVQSLQVHLG